MMDLNPEKLEVSKLTQHDVTAFNSLIHLFSMVFEEEESDTRSETHMLKLLRNNHFVAMAAFYENEIVGGLTAYELPMYYSE